MEIEWWIDDSGTNNLKGVEGDPNNPILVSDDFIIEFLRMYLPARQSFDRLFPLMLPEEKVRLSAIADVIDYAMTNPQDQSDAMQTHQNRMGVHTMGPLAGTRMQRM